MKLKLPETPRKKHFFLTFILGLIILAVAISNRKSPPLRPAAERATLVNVAMIEQLTTAPEITGFGRITPKTNWKAIAEVSGKLVYRHPELEQGRIIPSGTLILKIDPTDYELALARAAADLNASQAELAKITLEETSLQASLNIEQQRLELSHKELQRKEELYKKGILAKSNLDQERIQYLSRKSQTVDLQNQLSTIPDDRKIKQSQVSIHQARVDEAQRNLNNTSIYLPVTARVSNVNIELGQAVSQQQQMAELHGIETMEVEAQIALHSLKTLADSFHTYPDHSNLLFTPQGLSARLLVNSADYHYEVPAVATRLSESIDPNQGTVGVILEAHLNNQGSTQKESMPLTNGLFVEARLQGQPQQHLVVPEHALHGKHLYLIDESNRLQPTEVDVLFRRDGLAAIRGDIQAGNLIVVNDLIPAIPGMKLRYRTKEQAGSQATGDVL